MRRLLPILLLLGGAALAGAGCGSDEKSSTRASSRHAPGPKPEVRAPEGPPPKKLVVTDIRRGSGSAVEPGDAIEIHFVDLNLENGSRFESDWQGGGVVWRVGEGELSEGFERGIMGMRVGGRRRIVIPSHLGYETGPLVYVVELLDIL